MHQNFIRFSRTPTYGENNLSAENSKKLSYLSSVGENILQPQEFRVLKGRRLITKL